MALLRSCALAKKAETEFAPSLRGARARGVSSRHEKHTPNDSLASCIALAKGIRAWVNRERIALVVLGHWLFFAVQGAQLSSAEWRIVERWQAERKECLRGLADIIGTALIKDRSCKLRDKWGSSASRACLYRMGKSDHLARNLPRALINDRWNCAS